MPLRTGARTCALAFLLAIPMAWPRTAAADAGYQQIPFTQDWSNTAMIQVDDDWSGVPGVIGFYGYTPRTGQQNLDPRTLLEYTGPSDTLSSNRPSPDTDHGSGIAEFDGIADPVVAIQTSYDAGVVYLQFHVRTSGFRDVRVSCRLRDIDGSSDDCLQQFALQYRIDPDGRWSNVDGGYVSDATSGPHQLRETWMQATLPVLCDNLDRLQLRILTTDALGTADEWVGIDDFTVTGTPLEPGVMGVNLGWSSCATTAATASRLFACDDNGAAFTLVGSFRTDYDIADFVGISALVDVGTAGGTMPDWFAIGSGGCREGALSPVDVAQVAGCLNPYAPAHQGGGYVVQPGASPSQQRIWIDWVRDLPAPVARDTRYAAFVLSLRTAGAFDDGGGMCAGCGTPACFVLASVELYGLARGLERIIQSPDARNWAAWQSGTGDCPAPTPSRQSSWGAVKALYR